MNNIKWEFNIGEWRTGMGSTLIPCKIRFWTQLTFQKLSHEERIEPNSHSKNYLTGRGLNLTHIPKVISREENWSSLYKEINYTILFRCETLNTCYELSFWLIFSFSNQVFDYYWENWVSWQLGLWLSWISPNLF